MQQSVVEETRTSTIETIHHDEVIEFEIPQRARPPRHKPIAGDYLYVGKQFGNKPPRIRLDMHLYGYTTDDIGKVVVVEVVVRIRKEPDGKETTIIDFMRSKKPATRRLHILRGDIKCWTVKDKRKIGSIKRVSVSHAPKQLHLVFTDIAGELVRKR